MKVISNKDDYLLSQFGNTNGNDIPLLSKITELPPPIRDTPHQKISINIHIDANIGKIKGYLFLEDIFGSRKS